jgi:hypothetical protein
MTLSYVLPRLLVLACLLLAGCGSRTAGLTPRPVVFVEQMSATLMRELLLANQAQLSGRVSLAVTLDHRGAPLSCKARSVPDEHGPSGRLVAPPALLELVRQQCQHGVFPRPPQAMLDSRRQVQLVAPLIFPARPASPGAYSEYLKHQAPRQAYAWKQLLGGETPRSVGSAFFWYEGDASGKVNRCLVQLMPGITAPRFFQRDTALAARLQERCLALDLRQLPGFALDHQGVAQGHLQLDYAPWKRELGY